MSTGRPRLPPWPPRRRRLSAFRPRLLLTLGSGPGAVADDPPEPVAPGTLSRRSPASA